MIDQETRYRLIEIAQDQKVTKEIIDYTENRFITDDKIENLGAFPLSDERYIGTWERYLRESEEVGVFKTLQSYLVQFRFPIKKNISQSNDYRAATLRGISTEKTVFSTGLSLIQPDSLKLMIYDGAAGKIPVLIVPNNDDFSNIVRALSFRNEPLHIPKSMGAAMINGINNWDRILELKNSWLEANPMGNWSNEFVKNILPTRAFYQDKMIVLSQKPYSGVTSKSMGMADGKWEKNSLDIRLEHEYTHFFTLRHYGHMANNIHDELIADYMGISKILGKFNADWFLKFMGLEDYPNYRSGARLENYLGKPQISKKGFEILKTIVQNAAHTIGKFDDCIGPHQDGLDRTYRLMSLCTVGLLDIASEKGVEKLISVYKRLNCKHL